MNNLITLFLLAVLSSSALAFKMPSLPGAGSSEEASSGQSAVDAQEAIVGDFKAALGLVLQAQAQVAVASKMKELAKELITKANNIKGTNCGQTCMKETIESSAEAQKKIEENMVEGRELDAVSKKELTKAFPPLFKGTLIMSKLGPKAKDWAKSASSEIKGAGFTGAAKLKKKLGAGLYIVKVTPKLITKWTDTTSSFVNYAKKQGVPSDGIAGPEITG